MEEPRKRTEIVSPSRLAGIVLALSISVVVLSAACVYLAVGFAQQPRSHAMQATASCPPARPPPNEPIGLERVTAMFAYYLEHGMHFHEDIPPHLRGANWTFDNLLAHHTARNVSATKTSRRRTKVHKQFFSDIKGIISIGKLVWPMLKGSHSVKSPGPLEFLPESASSSGLFAMFGWERATSESFTLNVESGLWTTGCDFKFHIRWQHSGSLPGDDGKYIHNLITVEDSNNYGFTWDCDVDVTAAEAYSKAMAANDPVVAATTLTVRLKAASWFNTYDEYVVIEVTGDGNSTLVEQHHWSD